MLRRLLQLRPGWLFALAALAGDRLAVADGTRIAVLARGAGIVVCVVVNAWIVVDVSTPA